MLRYSFKSLLRRSLKLSTAVLFTSSLVSTSNLSKTEDLHEMVKTYYGEKFKPICNINTKLDDTIKQALKLIPSEILDRYYGCGNTIPFGIDGLTVVDLGCGSGRDCYIASNLVGESGKIIGVDMTDEQLEIAKRNTDNYCKNTLGYKQSNMEFRKGYIEALDDPNTVNIAPNSVDLVVSNCVLSLSPRKDLVLKSVYNILKEGGEFYFSDIYCDRRLPNDSNIQNDPILINEGFVGALYIEDFRRICKSVGFNDPRILEWSKIDVSDDKIQNMLGNAKFYSITYRLFKCDGMEDSSEDYGQIGVYNGSINENKNFYDLDEKNRFYTNKVMLISGNTALMISNSWLKQHFTVFGDTSIHYGKFVQ